MKKGFTLAEVLITLTIIGVVAAITIPQLVKNMNDYAFTKSKDITLAKITEATNQMKSNDVLSGYASNDAFVTEFQKYMKVTNRCDSSNLTKCFPAKFKIGPGQEIDTSTLTTGKKLDSNNLTDNTVGLMIANGTTILFSLRDSTKVGTACDRIEPTDNQTSTISCLSFLYDVNGSGQPNTLGKDIGAVNVNISTCTPLGSICVDSADLPAPILPANTCTGSPDAGLDPVAANGHCANNRWAVAKKMCEDKGMRLPTMNSPTWGNCPASGGGELCDMYNNRASLGGFGTVGYFSSTPYSNSDMWIVNFGNAFRTNYGKVGTELGVDIKVRCVK